MAQNEAAWINSASAQFAVKEAPKPQVGPGELVVKNVVVAVVSLHSVFESAYVLTIALESCRLEDSV
jgi:hypothetical protein